MRTVANQAQLVQSKTQTIHLQLMYHQMQFGIQQHMLNTKLWDICLEFLDLQCVQETCTAIVTVMLTTYIKFPTANDIDTVVREFKVKYGVPQCFGTIDGTHIPVSVPSENHTDYYNRKGWYSVLIQGLVDANYCFLDICVRWPGSVRDARVFVHSNLYKKLHRAN